MTNTTINKITYRRLNDTQVILSIAGYEKTLVLTYVAGWNGGGNNYRSAKWCVGLPNQFTMKSFPATINKLNKVSQFLMDFVEEYITV